MTDPTPPQKPGGQPPQSNAKPAAQPPAASPDDITRLILALSNPHDPLYDRAEDELIKLGPQAVPALIAALDVQSPWLRAYRAAEALGQIGDGRASRPLVAALRHPHSNVRFGVVRALAKVGDNRSILPLRKVARQDRGKTSWGESVAAAAKVALDDMQNRSALLRLSDPIKIALLVAVALLGVWLASGRITAFRTAISDAKNTTVWGTPVTPIIPTPAPDDPTETTEEDLTETTPTTTVVTATATPEAAAITAQIVSGSANIRSAPNTNNDPIGKLAAGDIVQIIEQAGEWYRIVLPDSTGTGWIAVSVVGTPSAPVPTAKPN